MKGQITMRMRKRDSNVAIESISRLVEMQYQPTNGELNNIHKRLISGRKEFEQAVKKTMDALIHMSAMDLTLEAKPHAYHLPTQQSSNLKIMVIARKN